MRTKLLALAALAIATACAGTPDNSARLSDAESRSCADGKMRFLDCGQYYRPADLEGTTRTVPDFPARKYTNEAY
jgi:hypothetical protein